MKKGLSIILCLAMVLSVFAVLPLSASAKDNNITNNGLRMEFAVTGSAKDSYGYDCVAYVQARFPEYHGFALHDNGGNNAAGYYTNAASFGDTVSSTAAAGALAVWGYGNVGFSHVAFVESVSGSTVSISEGGWMYASGKGYHTADRTASNMTNSWNDENGNYCFQEFLGYVYVKGTVNNTPDTEVPTVKNKYLSLITNDSYRVCVEPNDNVGIREVRIATWSQNDQGDLVWRNAAFNGYGTYFVDIKRADHTQTNTLYHNHIYIYDYAGNTAFTDIDMNYADISGLDPVNTVEYGNHKYELFDRRVTWKQAKQECERRGGYLAVVNSDEENEALKNLAADIQNYVWIGGTDEESEGDWCWVNGDSFSYNNWHSGEPNNTDNAEHYSQLITAEGTWNDAKNDSTSVNGFICEYSLGPESITLNKEKLSLRVDDSYDLNTTVSPDDVDNTITWISSDINVAAVDDSGKVTAVGYGIAFIYAKTVNGLEATCIVYVGEEKEMLLGDVDGDKAVTILDATAIQRHLASIPTTSYHEEAADADEDGSVTILDATAVQRYLASLPTNKNIGKAHVSALPQLSDWSEWLTTVPTDAEAVITQNRAEYRYKDRQIIKAAGQPETPEGFTLVSVDDCGEYSDWSEWSAWSTEKQSADGTTKGEESTTGYRYYCFACPNCGQRDPYQGACSKCGYELDISHGQTMYYPAIGSAVQAGDWDGQKGYVNIDGVMWFYEYPGVSNGTGSTGQPTETMYRYHTRSELKEYVYQQNTFSPWQAEAVTASDTREIETRVVYRYRRLL